MKHSQAGTLPSKSKPYRPKSRKKGTTVNRKPIRVNYIKGEWVNAGVIGEWKLLKIGNCTMTWQDVNDLRDLDYKMS